MNGTGNPARRPFLFFSDKQLIFTPFAPFYYIIGIREKIHNIVAFHFGAWYNPQLGKGSIGNGLRGSDQLYAGP